MCICAAGLDSEVPGDTLKRITSSNIPTLNQIRQYGGDTALKYHRGTVQLRLQLVARVATERFMEIY